MRPRLQVRETIVTTALLRLDRSVSRAAKLARAEQVIDEVDLRKCADAQIGNDLVGGISGGARRRARCAVASSRRAQGKQAPLTWRHILRASACR